MPIELRPSAASRGPATNDSFTQTCFNTVLAMMPVWKISRLAALPRLLLVFALCLTSAGASGCIWLAIPGLAYTGYQVSQGEVPGVPKAKATHSHRASSSSQHYTDDEME